MSVAGGWCASPRDQQLNHFFPRLKYNYSPALSIISVCGKRLDGRTGLNFVPDNHRTNCPNCEKLAQAPQA